MVEGTDPEILFQIMTNILLSWRNEKELLEGIVLTDGIIGIQAGMNPIVLKSQLLSYLGAKTALEAFRNN